MVIVTLPVIYIGFFPSNRFLTFTLGYDVFYQNKFWGVLGGFFNKFILFIYFWLCRVSLLCIAFL